MKIIKDSNEKQYFFFNTERTLQLEFSINMFMGLSFTLSPFHLSSYILPSLFHTFLPLSFHPSFPSTSFLVSLSSFPRHLQYVSVCLSVCLSISFLPFSSHTSSHCLCLLSSLVPPSFLFLPPTHRHNSRGLETEVSPGAK